MACTKKSGKSSCGLEKPCLVTSDAGTSVRAVNAVRGFVLPNRNQMGGIGPAWPRSWPVGSNLARFSTFGTRGSCTRSELAFHSRLFVNFYKHFEERQFAIFHKNFLIVLDTLELSGRLKLFYERYTNVCKFVGNLYCSSRKKIIYIFYFCAHAEQQRLQRWT